MDNKSMNKSLDLLSSPRRCFSLNDQDQPTTPPPTPTKSYANGSSKCPKLGAKALVKELLQKSNSDPVKRPRTAPPRLSQSVGGSRSSDGKSYALHTGSYLPYIRKKLGQPVSKCTLTLDGYSYVIVASPPENAAAPPSAQVSHSPLPRNGQLTKKGSLTILRRTSGKSLAGRYSKSESSDDWEFLDSVDLSEETLPSLESPEASEKAALRLRVLLRRLRQGQIPADALQLNIQYAVDVLETIFLDEAKRLGEEEDELSEVEPDAVPQEVREWLASTFTKQLQGGRRRNDEKPKFRSVANAIRAGIFVERIYRRLSSSTFVQLPPEVTCVLRAVDSWSFNVWKLNELGSGTPLKYLAYELFNRYGLLHKFKVPPIALESFLQNVEMGYCKYKNPYHNNVHAADVMQTIHFMLSQTGLMNWLTDVEIFAVLVAALIHDYEHTGTTNNFHVMSGSETALIYNDRAVLENYHISAAFRLLKEEENNVLTNLSREEFREFRSLVIDMVLATDMSSHFQQIKAMKTILSLPEPTLDKSKSLSLVLHSCDISHPSKEWHIHERWTSNLLEEFFRQGEKERELGLPYSPLCDRSNTLVAESQIGFIEFIVDPSMAVCGDLLSRIAAISSSSSVTPSIAEEPASANEATTTRPQRQTTAEIPRPWEKCLTVNKSKWKERAIRDAEIRAEQERRKEASETGNEETEEEEGIETEKASEGAQTREEEK